MNQAIAYLNFYLGTISTIVIIVSIALIGRAAYHIGNFFKGLIYGKLTGTLSRESEEAGE